MLHNKESTLTGTGMGISEREQHGHEGTEADVVNSRGWTVIFLES